MSGTTQGRATRNDLGLSPATQRNPAWWGSLRAGCNRDTDVFYSKEAGGYIADNPALDTCSQGLVVSVLEHLEDVLGQRLFDFSMAWDRLADTRSRVLIPIMPFTVSNENAAVLLDLTNEVATLHDSCSLATRRTSGMLPLVSS